MTREEKKGWKIVWKKRKIKIKNKKILCVFFFPPILHVLNEIFL